MQARFFITLSFVFTTILLTAQQDSLATQVLNDSLATQIDSIIAIEKGSDYPNPKKAALLSLAIPGAGHIYNKKYWKAPVTWAALGTAVFFIDSNTKTYRVLQQAYCENLISEGTRDGAINPCPDRNSLGFLDNNLGSGVGNPLSLNTDWNAVLELFGARSASSILPLRNNYDKYRQLSWVGALAVHLLSSAWVFVDGHFLDFDMSDDLSLRIEPSLQQTNLGAPVAGVGIVLVLGE